VCRFLLVFHCNYVSISIDSTDPKSAAKYVDLGKSLGISQGEMLNFITEYIKSDRDEQTKQREIEKKKRLKRMNVERNYALKKMIESIEKKLEKDRQKLEEEKLKLEEDQGHSRSFEVTLLSRACVSSY